MTTASIDPMNAAMSATEEPKERTYFGEIVTVDCWFVVLQKGVGKQVFDPTRHSVEQRRTAIKIEIDPLKGDFMVTQECLHFEAEWLNCTLPSLKKLNVELSALKGRYCQAKRIPTGQTYTNKQGETKEKTGLVFVEIYADGAACVQAAEQFFGSRVEAATEPGNPEKDFALKSLPALWKASNRNKDHFKTMIEQNPLIAKHYPWNSNVVQALVNDDADDLF